MCHYRLRSATWVVALLAMASLGGYRLAAQETTGTDHDVPPSTPAEEQPEVLGRGPVHEAFAEPVSMELQPGLIAPQQPPPNIEELPPTEKPKGQQFAWIPGYWAWDADRNGYIWVSACWRVAPPKMSWVPGYWIQVPGGWQWVAGFWTPADVRDLEYLPAPPSVGDIEPVGSPPSVDMIWVPPCMYWYQGQYVRRSGYWLAAQSDWVWVPSHYVVTPRGYLFASGHWDYSLERRGVLFAPVYFPAAVYGRVAFTYSPSIVVDLGLLQVGLFAYPFYSHYYFGDYYDDVYLRIGIYPWFDSWRYHTWYDPIYTHARWRNRSEPRWEEHERDVYRSRHDNKDLRPAHTFHEQESRLAKLPEPQRHALRTVQPMDAAIANRKTPLKFEHIDTDTQHKISKQAADVRTFRDERKHWESPAAGSKTAKPTGERPPTAAPSTEPRQAATRPPGERKPDVTPPTERRDKTPQRVASPTAHREKAPNPTAERIPGAPSPERKQAIQPPGRSESKGAATDTRQQPTRVSPRETQKSGSVRVEVPASPVVGRSGRQGFFQKGPPTQPADEARGKKDSHRK